MIACFDAINLYNDINQPVLSTIVKDRLIETGRLRRIQVDELMVEVLLKQNYFTYYFTFTRTVHQKNLHFPACQPMPNIPKLI